MSLNDRHRGGGGGFDDNGEVLFDEDTDGYSAKILSYDEIPSKFGENYIHAEFFIDPLTAGGFDVKEEEGELVVTFKGIFESRTPINNNNTIRIPIPQRDDNSSLPLLPIIERNLGRLNLSSSLLPPPQFPFPWVDTATGTDGYAKILTIDEIILKLGITEIRGEVECSKCHQTSTIGFDLQTESMEIGEYLIYHMDKNYNKYNLDGWLCPDQWLHPELPPCPNCCLDADQGQPPNSPSSSCYLKPVIPENDIDYKKINWLFLFLGEMLGCCSVEHLNFFCKHSTSDYHHRRTGGAKDCLLYLTYLTLCKQLYPTGPFDPPI